MTPSMIDVIAPATVAMMALSIGALMDVPSHQILGVLSFAGGWMAGSGARVLATRRLQRGGRD